MLRSSSTIMRLSRSPGSHVNRARFTSDLRTLGVTRGDALYVRAGLGVLGRVSGDLFDSVVGGFLGALGPDGNLIAPVFRAVGNVFQRDSVRIDASTPSNSGALSKLLLRHPDAVRSAHPSHSFVAIGPAATDLLEGHGRVRLASSPSRGSPR